MPVGNAAPPLPRKPESATSLTISSGLNLREFLSPLNPSSLS